jgi:hypothetical protein
MLHIIIIAEEYTYLNICGKYFIKTASPNFNYISYYMALAVARMHVLALLYLSVCLSASMTTPEPLNGFS